MTTKMLRAAMSYWDTGLSVIPIKPKLKAPAPYWKDFMFERAPRDTVAKWFSNGSDFNVGIIHGEVSNGYVVLDFDHEAGIFNRAAEKFPELFDGRIILSGSGEGYHVPVMVGELPNFGMDHKKDRPRGNREWKTEYGNLNIRAQWCQSVAPPSIHPSGGEYTIIQPGPIIWVPDLTKLVTWLNEIAPKVDAKAKTKVNGSSRPEYKAGEDLLTAVTATWTSRAVFEHFGLAVKTGREPSGETRLYGNGGLLIDETEDVWYNHTWEVGGGPIEAWIVCSRGTAQLYDKTAILRQALYEMAQAASIPLADYYRRGDRQYVKAGDVGQPWTQKYGAHWQLSTP